MTMFEHLMNFSRFFVFFRVTLKNRCVCVCVISVWFLRVVGNSGYPESGDNFYPVDLDGVVYDSFNLRTDLARSCFRASLGGRCCE